MTFARLKYPVLALLILAVLLSSKLWQSEEVRDAVVPRKGGQPKPYFGDYSSLAAINVRDAELNEITSDLKYPWAFEFLSPQELLVTEFAGRLKLLDLKTRQISTIQGLPELSKKAGKNQIGLMDVALHPRFEENQIIYLSHAVDDPDDPGLHATAISRGKLQQGSLVDVEQIYIATPFTDSASNFGGALEFDDEGFLYLGSGDRSKRGHAQKPGSRLGKIIRLNDDGTIPADNPFFQDSAVEDSIYAMGVRNPQGLFFDAVSGALFETEHGPMGGDEVNLIEAGKNYGWPMATYGKNYSTARIGRGTAVPGMEQPLYYYLPSIATSPIVVYRGALFPEWEGDALVGSMKFRNVSKLDVVDGAVKSDQRLLVELKNRVRDIKVASDGSIYLLLQEDGAVVQLTRNPSQGQPKVRGGREVYAFACSTCHTLEGGHAPKLDDANYWRAKLKDGRDRLYQNAVEGVGDMPAKGFCESCTDEEVRAAVDFMLKKIKQ